MFQRLQKTFSDDNQKSSQSDSHLLQEASFLTQIGNSGAIVMGEHFVAEYCISNLWCMDKIHLKEAGLQVALFWFVIFESIQQK